MRVTQKVFSTVDTFLNFIRRDIWRIRSGTLPPQRFFLLKQLRIIILAFRGFDEDKCRLRASALTMYSLLSIVPAAALAFGVAKGFNIEERLEKVIYERFSGQEEVIARVITYARTMLEEARGGLIAGIGVVLLFWLIIKLLGNIEDSFNDIWGITHSRTYVRRLSDYLSVMLICPVLLVMSSSVTVFFVTQINMITQRITLLGSFSPLINLLLKALPYFVVWAVFTFMYIFMPNTKVQFKSAFLGGVVAGTIYQIVQWGYITFQVGAARYGAIYGSFAALPLFLIWLQISWFIVLFGAELSFAAQNVETYEFEPDSLNVKASFKKLLSLRIAHVCVNNFANGKKPWSAEEISHALEIPMRLVNLILSEFIRTGILSEVWANGKDEALYQPARSLDLLSINYIIKALDDLGTDDLPIFQSEELDRISLCLQQFSTLMENSDANLLLKDVS